MRHESCLAAVALEGTPCRDAAGINQLEMFYDRSHICCMSWTDDQIAAMKSLGINPALVPFVVPSQSRDFTGDPEMHDAGSDDLTDDEFATLVTALPSEPRQRGAVSNRQILNALLWVHRSGKRLTQLPARYGTPEAIRKRAERWALSKVWERVSSNLANWNGSPIRGEAFRQIAETQTRRGRRIRLERQR